MDGESADIIFCGPGAANQFPCGGRRETMFAKFFQKKCNHNGRLIFVSKLGGDRGQMAQQLHGGRCLHQCADCGAQIWRVEPVLTLNEAELVATLIRVVQNDANYDLRYQLLLQAALLTSQLGGGTNSVGFRIDPADPDWPVVFLELPTGQASWHMPAHPIPWDGHTTEQKFTRIREYAASAQ